MAQSHGYISYLDSLQMLLFRTVPSPDHLVFFMNSVLRENPFSLDLESCFCGSAANRTQ